MLSKLLLGAGLILSPAIGLAQAAPSLYIGASASMLSTNPFRGYNSNVFGPAVTVGYQLSPRWAIQSGASMNWQNYQSTSLDYTGASIFNQISYDTHYTQLVIPLLARYTFTAPASPLHLDALFGGNLIHTTRRSSTAYFYKAGNTDVYDNRYSDNTFNLGIGPSVRYTLVPHLDVTATSLLQTTIRKSEFFDYFYLTTQLGIQYTFGQ
jgi:hypothetical protein